MIRESLDPAASHAFLFGTTTGEVAFANRDEAGASTNTVDAGTGSPVWLKLERRDGLLTASRSLDGVSWTFAASASVSMAAEVFVGLAASSHSRRATSRPGCRR